MRKSIQYCYHVEEGYTIGLDLGDRHSQYCGISGKGEVIIENRVSTTPSAMHLEFGSIGRKTIAIETGTHSPWSADADETT